VVVPQSVITETVHLALTEDIGTGDVTAELIPPDRFALASVITREPCILCGMDWFEEVFRQLDDEVLVEWHAEDGEALAAGDTVCSLTGPAVAILTGERTALNFLQTLSGTATQAKRYADAVAHTTTRVLDTRKTIPGLRLAQKYAVHCGGCDNHRIGLFDAVLIKENHIVAAGSISAAVEEARFRSPDLMIEVEVETLAQLDEALATDANRILLDNFDLATLREAVARNAGRKQLEASGNVTLDNIGEIAATGVDFISTGSLTKHVTAIDLSMRID
jgi:nicotinate-nucleotide pyrophosphorylase (carboxylating)